MGYSTQGDTSDSPEPSQVTIRRNHQCGWTITAMEHIGTSTTDIPSHGRVAVWQKTFCSWGSYDVSFWQPHSLTFLDEKQQTRLSLVILLIDWRLCLPHISICRFRNATCIPTCPLGYFGLDGEVKEPGGPKIGGTCEKCLGALPGMSVFWFAVVFHCVVPIVPRTAD